MRYARLYLYFLQFSFSRAMEFRIDFFFRFIMDIIFYLVNIGFYKVVYQHTSTLAGWPVDKAMAFVGGVFVIDAIVMTVFSANVWWLPTLINKGDLDYYILRPVSSLFFLSLREFSANSFMNLVIACSFWFWSIGNLADNSWTWIQLLGYVLLILNGAYLFFVIQMLFVLPVFWTHSPLGFHDLFWTLENFGQRPHRIYRPWLRAILLTVLPFSMMSSLPATMFFDGFEVEMLALTAAVSLVFTGILVWIWSLGLKNYSSASS